LDIPANILLTASIILFAAAHNVSYSFAVSKTLGQTFNSDWRLFAQAVGSEALSTSAPRKGFGAARVWTTPSARGCCNGNQITRETVQMLLAAMLVSALNPRMKTEK